MVSGQLIRMRNMEIEIFVFEVKVGSAKKQITSLRILLVVRYC